MKILCWYCKRLGARMVKGKLCCSIHARMLKRQEGGQK